MTKKKFFKPIEFPPTEDSPQLKHLTENCKHSHLLSLFQICCKKLYFSCTTRYFVRVRMHGGMCVFILPLRLCECDLWL